MPRFDSIARAAVTPGGFQAGVNDIAAAVLQADAQKAQAAQQAKALGLQDQRLAEQIRANMAGEQNAMLRHSEGLGLDKQRLGEQIRHNTAMENRPGYQANEGLEEKRGFDLDLAMANTEAFGNPDGVAWIDQTVPDPFGLGEPVVKKVKGPPDQKLVDKRDQRFKELRAIRANGGQGLPPTSGRIVDQVVPKAGTAPTSPAAPATPAPLGPPTAGKPNGEPTVDPNARPMSPGKLVDYTRRDAKYLKASPKYRQMRADPSFDWKAFLDARALH